MAALISCLVCSLRLSESIPCERRLLRHCEQSNYLNNFPWFNNVPPSPLGACSISAPRASGISRIRAPGPSAFGLYTSPVRALAPVGFRACGPWGLVIDSPCGRHLTFHTATHNLAVTIIGPEKKQTKVGHLREDSYRHDNSTPANYLL